ncbi:MAG: Yip1 family protein [Candidatus Competibacterales bacterium]|nr:Yip1 family protein [Candidatus Competibacterales bacterium]
MLIKHVLSLMLSPKSGWRAIRDDEKSIPATYLQLVLILGLIPPFAGFYGTTQIGWRLGWEEPVKLTVDSALTIAVLFYLAIQVAVFAVGKGIHWMSTTYGANASLARSVRLAAFTVTPLFLVSVVQFYPVLWVNFLVTLPALMYTVFLLYTGVPIMMEISEERGFLFSSAVLTFGLVAFVALMAFTVILWGFGVNPEFIQ